MKNQIIFLITALILSLLTISCKHDKTDISTYPEICFKSEVAPIFGNNCAISGCHKAGSAEGNILIDTSYQAIIQGISPGDPLKSKFYKAITNEWINMMPPDNPLSQNQRTTIRLWIEQGAKETACSPAK